MRLRSAFLGVLLALAVPAAARGDANVLLTDYNATSDSTGALISVSPSGVQKAVSTNALSTAAGGPALFSQPADVAVAPDGTLYVLDYQSNNGGAGALDKIDPATGRQTSVSTNAISQAAGGESKFFSPQGLLVGQDGFLYVTDADTRDPSEAAGTTEGGIIRVNPMTGAQTLVASDYISSQQGGETAFHNPYDSVQLADGGFAVADDPSGSNGNSVAAVIKVSSSGKQSYLSTNAISQAAGGQAAFASPRSITRGPDGVVYVADYGGSVIRVEPDGKATAIVAAGSAGIPIGIDYASDGNVYFASFNNGVGMGVAVSRVAPSGGPVTTVSTNASSAAAGGDSLFNSPSGLLASGVPSSPVSPAQQSQAPAVKPQCSNGRDDDADGATDLADPGCSSASDNSEGDETVSDLVLCGRRKLSLVAADAKGGKVVLRGLVAASLVGRKIQLVQTLGHKTVTLKTVKPGATGAFSATVSRPSAKRFAKVRYQARVGKARSTALKLPQSLASSSIRRTGGQIVIKGAVKRSLVGSRKPIVIQRLVCGRYRTVATVRPSASGTYTARFSAPAIGAAALYRAQGQVLARPGSKRYVKQYARAVSITLTGQTG